MAAPRTLTATHRCWLLALLACAMLARAIVPGGWMPLVDAHGVRIVLCPGSGPAIMAAPHAMAGMHHGSKVDHGAPGAADHPCAFAGVTPGIETPVPAAPPALALLRATPTPVRALISIGHGLAAPPPPQTGPPARLRLS